MKRIRLNSQVRKAFRGGSRGFTLLEVVIAIALIGLIGVAVLSALSTASLALIIADQRATAESLARSQWEYIKSQNYTAAPDGGVGNYTKINTTGYPSYSIWSVSRNGTIVNGSSSDTVIGIPWNSGNNTAAYKDKGLQKITVIVIYYTVRGDNGMREQKYTLVDYKRNPEAEVEE